MRQIKINLKILIILFLSILRLGCGGTIFDDNPFEDYSNNKEIKIVKEFWAIELSSDKGELLGYFIYFSDIPDTVDICFFAIDDRSYNKIKEVKEKEGWLFLVKIKDDLIIRFFPQYLGETAIIGKISLGEQKEGYFKAVRVIIKELFYIIPNNRELCDIVLSSPELFL